MGQIAFNKRTLSPVKNVRELLPQGVGRKGLMGVLQSGDTPIMPLEWEVYLLKRNRDGK